MTQQFLDTVPPGDINARDLVSFNIIIPSHIQDLDFGLDNVLSIT